MADLPVVQHASLGASSAKRWMTCPGSVSLCETVPDVETDYAIEGTVAHHVASESLMLGLEPDAFLGEEYEGVMVDEEMVEAVRVFTDYVRSREPHFDELHIETRVNLDPLEPPRPMFGTADALLSGSFLEVADYKHGRGVYVSEENNPQIMYYALGGLLRVLRDQPMGAPMPNPVVMTIVQPRIGSEPVRSSLIQAEELLAWGKEVLVPAAQRTIDEPETYVAGDHCQFCDAAGVCPELRKESVALLQAEFEEAPLPAVLSPQELGQVLEQAKMVEDWISAVRQYALAEAERGRPPEGYKLVPKRARRRWALPDSEVLEVLEILGVDPEEAAPPKIRSPAQMEKLIGRELIEPIVEAVSSGPKLAPVDHPAPALNSVEDDLSEFLIPTPE